MNESNEKRMKELLRAAYEPVDSELRQDLWPKMLARMDQRSARVPWFDWALIALVILWLCLSPETIPALLYHL
jgi:hypothetical protein